MKRWLDPICMVLFFALIGTFIVLLVRDPDARADFGNALAIDDGWDKP